MEAPLRKLTVNLIHTYKHINEVRATSDANACAHVAVWVEQEERRAVAGTQRRDLQTRRIAHRG